MKSDINNNTLIIKGEDGKTTEYEIIAKISSKENKKDYLVFTANELDADGYIITYAYIVNPNKKDNNLYPIETEEEYEFIEKLLSNLDNKIN